VHKHTRTFVRVCIITYRENTEKRRGGRNCRKSHLIDGETALLFLCWFSLCDTDSFYFESACHVHFFLCLLCDNMGG